MLFYHKTLTKKIFEKIISPILTESGGSGSGKTRFFVKPNLMQMHSSYVVTDPKGTVLIECGKMLKRGKYKIKILNTINFAKSMHYNRATCSPLKRRRTALFLTSSVN